MNDLHDVRTALTVGHYSKVINLAVSKHFGAGVSPLVLWERDFLIAQAQIALQQYDLVLSDLSKRTVEPSLSGSLAAVEALTQYMKARDQGNIQLRVASVARMQQIVAEAPNPGGLTLDYDATICICAATVLINESSVDKAFILLRRAHDTLVPLIGPNSETRLNSIFLRICSLLLESLLRIHRIDMAENILIEMNKLDDDAVSSMLSTVVYNLHAHNYNVGGVETAAQKITEARHILDELISKYGNSVTLLNLSGVVELSRGNYESAERSYLDALDKRSTDIGALIGLCRVSIHLGKPTELIDRYLTQLKATAATHPWVQEYTTLEHQITSA